MNIEQLIRELSDAEGFYDEVHIVKQKPKNQKFYTDEDYIDYKVWIDNSEVYIILEDK